MLLSTVYPTVKPLLEGAIRRLTVTVRWSEGNLERSFSVVEYVTNPGQTLPAAEVLNAAQQALGAATGVPGAPGATPPASGPVPVTPTTPMIPGGSR